MWQHRPTTTTTKLREMINTNKYIERVEHTEKKVHVRGNEEKKHMRNNSNNSAICKLYRKFLLLWLLFSLVALLLLLVFWVSWDQCASVCDLIIITFIQQLSFEMGSTVWSHHLMLFMDIFSHFLSFSCDTIFCCCSLVCVSDVLCICVYFELVTRCALVLLNAIML